MPGTTAAGCGSSCSVEHRGPQFGPSRRTTYDSSYSPAPPEQRSHTVSQGRRDEACIGWSPFGSSDGPLRASACGCHRLASLRPPAIGTGHELDGNQTPQNAPFRPRAGDIRPATVGEPVHAHLRRPGPAVASGAERADALSVLTAPRARRRQPTLRRWELTITDASRRPTAAPCPPPRGPGPDLSIESLRGLAIVLMVAGHVIGNTADRGLEVSDGSTWRLAYLALDDVRLPLFTFLSGFVYAYRPVRTPSKMSTLLCGKARRLLMPMVTVGLLLLVVQAATPGTNADPGPGALMQILFFGYEHLWFVQAIFLVFLLVGALDAFGALRTTTRLSVATVLASTAAVFVQLPSEVTVFSTNGAMDLLPFFLLGYLLHRRSDVVRGPRVLWPVATALSLAASLRLHSLLGGAAFADVPDRLLGLVVGLLGVTTLFLLRARLELRQLAWLGGFAYTIYLLHVFGSAGARILLEGIGVGPIALLFPLALAAGLALPVVFELAVGRYRLVSLLVLGQRARRRGDRAVL